MKIETIEIAGLAGALTALRLPFGKEVRSEINIKCDACGCLCDEELWMVDSHEAQETADESGWQKLGEKNYCPNCWKYDENDNIITADGKLWNGDILIEIK